MSSTICGIVKTAITFCDIINTADAIEQLRQGDEEDNMLHTASLVNKLIILGFGCAEAAALAQGASNDTLFKLKGVELIPRSLEVFFKAFRERAVLDGTLRGNIQWFERACVAPIADLTRVIAEGNIYQEKNFLAMTPEERAQAERPIYEYDSCREYLEIVGYKPVDAEECKANIESLQKLEMAASSLKVLAEASIASTLISVGSLYENLVNFLHSYNSGLTGNTQAAFSLLALREIPVPLHADAVLSRYICPITQMPIRHPVGDPNGNAVYERQAIRNWLMVRRVSPITRLPLLPSQLIQKPGLQALINHRLRFHERQLWDYVQQSQHLQGSLTVPADQVIQQAADRENPLL